MVAAATQEPTIIVADDERGIADLYTAYLEEYEVRTAYDGEEAVELVDDSVDILLLDRSMPGYSGREVLQHVRGQDIECLVALVTGFEPDTEIIEEGFDDYLVKPVSDDELHETVEQLLTRLQYDSELREYFALLSQQAALDHSEEASGELIAGEMGDEITAKLESKKADVAGLIQSLSEEEIRTMLRAGFVNDDSELPQHFKTND